MSCECKRHDPEGAAPDPLHRAAFFGCADCTLQLIETGISVDTKDSLHETPLFVAVRYCNIEVVRQLLDHNASVDLENLNNHTALDLAALYIGLDSQARIAKMLIDRGAQHHLVGASIYEPVNQLITRRKLCQKTINVFLGIRKKLNSVRDTHEMIGKLVWSTRFYEVW